MLYILHGDRIQVKKNLTAHLASLKAKRPDAELFRIDADNFSKDIVRELLASQGLFEKKYIVVLEDVLSNKERREDIQDFFSDMQTSEHVWLCAETSLDEKVLKVVTPFTQKIWEFTEKQKKENYNVFTLATHLGTRNAKKLWVEYVRLIENGVSAEEIVGVLYWQIKNIYIVSKTKTAKESGLAPFVYSNAESYAKKWKAEELNRVSETLLASVDRARKGEGELGVFVEQLVLTI
jgi:DNA polymerase III delta subunit